MEPTRQNNSITAINDVRILLNELKTPALTSIQKNVLWNDEGYLKNISKHLKNLKNHFKKYQYGLDYLFNEHNEEDQSSDNNINAIKNARDLFNEIRSNLSHEEINRIRKKRYKKEVVYNILKEQEQEGSLTNKEKKVLKNIGRCLKNIAKHLKNLEKHFKKLKKYQYGLDYLFNEHSEEEYTPNNDNNVFKEPRKLLNERKVIVYIKKQRELEKSSIEQKLPIMF